jgi:ribonucleoside-diphosphate reductase alpha chain
MGLADMLIKLGLEYGDSDSLKLCSKIGFAMSDNAILQSALLASENGAYPMYNKESIFKSEYFNKCTSQHTKKIVEKYGIRNSQLLTIAPTGSISTMLGISGGIEPIYNISYTRKTESLHGEEKFYKVYTPIVKEYMEIHNISKEEDLPDFFVTAMNLNYKDRIEMQAVWQKHIDASISSTVNVPESFTVEEVEDLYMLAWEKGLKGVTIYRDNCRRSGILINTTEDNNEDKSDNEESKKDINLSWGTIIEASDDLIGKKRKLITGCGSLHVLAYFDPDTGDLSETYLNKGSTGGCNNFMVGLSRMLSLSARAGVGTHTIVDQLNSSGTCPSYSVRRATKGDASKGSCCPSAIANALLDMQQEVWDELGIESNTNAQKSIRKESKKNTVQKNRCPECDEEIMLTEGCVSCRSCGWSKCS